MPQKLVLFDFDGTLTRHDSLFLFLCFAGKRKFWSSLHLLLSSYIMYKCTIYSAQKGKENMLKILFCGKSKKELETLGKDFIAYLLAHKKRFFRKNALESIEKYKEDGAHIYIVSASPEMWIAPFAKHFGIMHIATRVAYEQGIFKGNFLGENCNGQEKARRIAEDIVDLASFSSVVAYGDSKGDFAMFDLATTTHFKPFRNN